MPGIMAPRRGLLLGAAMAWAPRWAAAQGGGAAPTPACGDQATPRQTEGPYFKPASPERGDIAAGLPGVRLVLTGIVTDTRCRPVPRALLDVWQADAAGEYDLAGMRLRGHLFTDAEGRYRLASIVPRWYGAGFGGRGFAGRTPHIHLKLQAPGGRVLTTQLYFPPELGAYGQDIARMNQADGLFDPRLVMALSPAGESYAGRYDFVLAG